MAEDELTRAGDYASRPAHLRLLDEVAARTGLPWAFTEERLWPDGRRRPTLMLALQDGRALLELLPANPAGSASELPADSAGSADPLPAKSAGSDIGRLADVLEDLLHTLGNGTRAVQVMNVDPHGRPV